MHFKIEVVAALVLALAGQSLAEDEVYTTGITGSAIIPVITPGPTAVGPPVDVTGPLTISVTNSHGSGLHASFGHDSGSPTAISAPTNGPIGDHFKAVYPAGWAGRIAVGYVQDANIINRGSLIEASYKSGAPNIDISYVQGFSVPIVCSCGGANANVITGCNQDLFALGNCGNPGPSGDHVCFNPKSNSPQPTGSAAAPFFQPCAGKAYTYPNDNGADSGCGKNLISCCIGASCPGRGGNSKRSIAGRLAIES